MGHGAWGMGHGAWGMGYGLNAEAFPRHDLTTSRSHDLTISRPHDLTTSLNAIATDLHVHRKRNPRNDPRRAPAWRDQPRSGLPGFPDARTDEGCRGDRHSRRHQPDRKSTRLNSSH